MTDLSTSVAGADWLAVVDATDTTTKKVLISNVLKNANLNTTAGDIGGAWVSWTPTLSGLFDNAKWNKTGSYTQIGKTIHFKLRLVANNTTPMSGAGNAVATLPVTSAAFTAGDANMNIIGTAGILDAGTALFTATIGHESTTTIRIKSTIATALTSSVPMTWTTSDEIYCQGTYEAA